MAMKAAAGLYILCSPVFSILQPWLPTTDSAGNPAIQAAVARILTLHGRICSLPARIWSWRVV
jgi:hypothetical protein